MTQVALVTGAARGLGLEMTRQLLARDHRVIACPRQGTAEELIALAETRPDRLQVVAMDVADDASIAAAAGEISNRVDRIDVLFNNAGYYPDSGSAIEGLDAGEMVKAFRINALGPLQVVHALLPLLRAGTERRLVQITSLMGSIADNSSGGSYAYRMSKAALNMAVRNLAHELGGEGFVAVAVHPGWVQTRMGGGAAPLEIEPAVAAVIETALRAAREDNGLLLAPDGTHLPW